MKSYKTEIILTEEQQLKVKQTIGVCRFCYNFFVTTNQQFYCNYQPHLNAKKFSVWFNNEYYPNHPEISWVKDVSSKSVKRAFENAESAYKKFFNHTAKFPRFKKKHNNDVSMYFVKNNETDCLCERHRIKIPTIGWVKLKEKGYIPTDRIISSGTISHKAGRYYVSVLIKEEEFSKTITNSENQGIGIDLGIKETAVLSTGKVYKNINKTSVMKKLNKKIKREQRKLSRKIENKRKGVATEGKNLAKQTLKLQKLYQRKTSIKDDFQSKMIDEIVKTKPSYITIEDLNTSGMIKNRHLSKAIQEQRFYYIRSHLENKCRQNDIELRVVDRFYPSSKICHNCGQIKSDLKLSDRIYKCDCGYVEDRDLNAALNLRDAKTYEIA